MKNVIIIGAGGHGAEIFEYIQYDNLIRGIELNLIGFLDDNPSNYACYKLSAPLIGGIKDHAIRSECHYIIGIANLTYRRKIVEQYLSRGAKFVSAIHHSAYVSPSAFIGNG